MVPNASRFCQGLSLWFNFLFPGGVNCLSLATNPCPCKWTYLHFFMCCKPSRCWLLPAHWRSPSECAFPFCYQIIQPQTEALSVGLTGSMTHSSNCKWRETAVVHVASLKCWLASTLNTHWKWWSLQHSLSPGAWGRAAGWSCLPLLGLGKITHPVLLAPSRTPAQGLTNCTCISLHLYVDIKIICCFWNVNKEIHSCWLEQ